MDVKLEREEASDNDDSSSSSSSDNDESDAGVKYERELPSSAEMKIGSSSEDHHIGLP
jgi:hypothetical protein